jgi:hypothetical protein
VEFLLGAWALTHVPEPTARAATAGRLVADPTG